MVLTKTHTKYGIQQMLDIVIATYEKNDGCFTRDLVFLEVASGWGETSFWVKEFGGSGQEFDSQTRHEDENLNQLVGLFLLFYWVFSFKKYLIRFIFPIFIILFYLYYYIVILLGVQPCPPGDVHGHPGVLEVDLLFVLHDGTRSHGPWLPVQVRCGGCQ